MSVLKIDLDGRWTPCKWLKWCDHAAKICELTGVSASVKELRRSPSGGIHVKLEVPDMADMEVVALQAILRSDGKREALNFRRAREGVPGNVLHDHRNGGQWGAPWPQGLVALRRALE